MKVSLSSFLIIRVYRLRRRENTIKDGRYISHATLQPSERVLNQNGDFSLSSQPLMTTK